MPRILYLRTALRAEPTGLHNREDHVGTAADQPVKLPRSTERLSSDAVGRERRHRTSMLALPARGPIDPRAFWRLLRAIRVFRPDVLHPHDFKSGLVSVLFAAVFRIPVVMTLPDGATLGKQSGWRHRLRCWIMRRMDHIVVNSSEERRYLESMRVPAQRHSVIERGVDCSRFTRRQDAATVKRGLGIPTERHVLGSYLSAYDTGSDVLIHAVHRLLMRGYDLELLILGDERELACLGSLPAQLRNSGRLRFSGNGRSHGRVGHEGARQDGARADRVDPVSVFQAMDVFVLTGTRGGVPNELLEACATAVPIVAAQVDDVDRVVENGRNGYLLRSVTAEQLAAAILLLLDDAALREKFGRHARHVVERRFSSRVRAARLRAVYDAVLNQRNAGAESIHKKRPRKVSR